jgi:hypothetical protein
MALSDQKMKGITRRKFLIDFHYNICIIKWRENKAFNLLGLFGLPVVAWEHGRRSE